MLKSRKGAISLAMSTIVMIIISLVILASGIILLNSWLSGAEEIKAQLDSRTQGELERLLIDQGKKIALPLHTATVQGGDGHVFGLGVLNIDDEAYGEKFQTDITLSKVLDGQDEDITLSVDELEVLSWVLYESTIFLIEENQHYSLPILVDTPASAKKGTYIFNVKVTFIENLAGETGQYDNTKKFYVTVQ